jgi:hypothetical protein
MPTLKRRFCTLHVGPGYEVRLEYRKSDTSSICKGSYSFTAATKCIASNSIGTFSSQQCVVVADLEAKFICCFDSPENRQLFEAAFEWAMNARAHVAAFRSKQEEDHIITEEHLKLAQAKRPSSNIQVDQPKLMQHALSCEKMQDSSMECQEFASRLARESVEHRKHLHMATRTNFGHFRANDSLFATALLTCDEVYPAPTIHQECAVASAGGQQIYEDFVQRIAFEQAAHSALLSVAARAAFSP